ncbi:MAG TPA: 3-oxoacid CoA-transferase subunit B [Acidimicrobiales bacterium]
MTLQDEKRIRLYGDVRPWTAQEMASNIASDLPNGIYVNLGIGRPTRVAAELDPAKGILFHSENGILGLGPPPEDGFFDPDLIDAGKNLATVVPGGSFFSHAEAFAMIRGGHIDVSIMGAFQVSQDGDLANWAVPEQKLPAVGGAMDLAVGARLIVAMMTHTTSAGEPKLVQECSYPVTASAVVSRVYTDLIVANVVDHGFEVIDAAPGVDAQLVDRVTDAKITWCIN